MPNPGRIKMYTSGCPKNQNKCWYKIGSPPPAGSKNLVLKFRSVSSIVIAPAKTGKESSNKKAVTRTDQTNNLSRSKVIAGDRILKIVVIKLIAPRREDIPARCKEKIAKSTEQPPCPIAPERGG